MKKDMLKTALVKGDTTKTDERIFFFGTIDELSCFIMELSHHLKEKSEKESLVKIVQNLSKIMGIVAGMDAEFEEENINELLVLIKNYQNRHPKLKHFIIPGQTLLSSKIHIVRTIVRRAELAYAKVYEKYGGSDIIFEYLNRLSTYFFELAYSYENFKASENL